MPSILDMDESTAPWQGTGRARLRLGFMPERSGANISSILSLYNSSYAGMDRHNALVLPQRRVLPEDVLR